MQNHWLKIAAFFWILSLSPMVFAQEIVVSEYYNATAQNDEWTELVVVKDNLDLRGWYLGDNNAGTSSWQPKIRFSNHPLWQHLRAGTIIQIDHAANEAGCDDVTDTTARDGFIRICCRNATYFEGGSTTTLFLADGGDFVQIVDPSGKMVHAIGHDEDPGSSVEGGNCFSTSNRWTNTSSAESATRPCGNFLFYRFQMVSPTSLRIVAGDLSDFTGGMQTNAQNGKLETSETPFSGIGNGPSNNLWLTQLRAPIMAAQTICPVKLPGSGGIRLTWLPATDPFASDNTIGYLVLRNQNGDFPLPTQSIQHTLGEFLGSGNQTAEVVGVLNGSASTTFTDPNPPQNATYRIYAFRYNNNPGFFHPTRGRSYNTNQFVKVNSDPAPNLVVYNDTLCGPGIATLSFEPLNLPNPGAILWYSSPTGGNPLLMNQDTFRVAVSQTTSYWIEIQSAANCSNQRYEVKAVIQPFDFELSGSDSVCVGTPGFFEAADLPGVNYTFTILQPFGGLTITRVNDHTVSINVANLRQSRWVYVRVQATNAEGCSAQPKLDSMYTVPFFPTLLATTATPDPGASVLVEIQREQGNEIVRDWGVFGGTPVNSDFRKINLIATGPDSVIVTGVASKILPNDALFCVLDIRKAIPIRKDTLPVEPLKPINNLITRNGNPQNSTLNFDRRKVRQITIYNRWGKEVFQAGDYFNTWTPEAGAEGPFFYTAEVLTPGEPDFKPLQDWIWVAQ
jgi:hypothetical protein